MMIYRPQIAIIGGSGFPKLLGLEVLNKICVRTKYGRTSDRISIGEYGGKVIAFLPRHGANHDIFPHQIPYRANIAALKQIGVDSIISTSVVGSLKLSIRPGDFVIPDQFINFTWGRDETIRSNIHENELHHLPMAKPYCSTLTHLIYLCTKKLRIPAHPKGTVVVIQGPRFSTIAESKWFSSQGWDIVNMTQYPECYFAREMKIHYATIALVTDYDVGAGNNMQMNTRDIDKVVKIFYNNIDKANKLLLKIIQKLPIEYKCDCKSDLEEVYYKHKKP